jgi:hypothetical protein
MKYGCIPCIKPSQTQLHDLHTGIYLQINTTCRLHDTHPVPVFYYVTLRFTKNLILGLVKSMMNNEKNTEEGSPLTKT